MLPTPPLMFQASWPRNGLNRSWICCVGITLGIFVGAGLSSTRDSYQIPASGVAERLFVANTKRTVALHSGHETSMFIFSISCRHSSGRGFHKLSAASLFAPRARAPVRRRGRIRISMNWARSRCPTPMRRCPSRSAETFVRLPPVEAFTVPQEAIGDRNLPVANVIQRCQSPLTVTCRREDAAEPVLSRSRNSALGSLTMMCGRAEFQCRACCLRRHLRSRRTGRATA